MNIGAEGVLGCCDSNGILLGLLGLCSPGWRGGEVCRKDSSENLAVIEEVLLIRCDLCNKGEACAMV